MGFCLGSVFVSDLQKYNLGRRAVFVHPIGAFRELCPEALDPSWLLLVQVAHQEQLFNTVNRHARYKWKQHLNLRSGLSSMSSSK